MATERKCGECTLCCKTHAILELRKPSGVWCSNCEINKGCRIYNERPESCRDFTCEWLIGYGLPEQRPDKTGIVPEFKDMPDLGIVLFLWAALNDEVLVSDFAKRQTRLNLRVGKPVMHVPIHANPKFYLPEGWRREDFILRMATS